MGSLADHGEEQLTVRELIRELLLCDMDAKVFDADGHPLISAHHGDGESDAEGLDQDNVYIEAEF